MSIRTEKVGEEIKHRLSEILSRELADQHMGLVSITKVLVTPDIKSAKIYLSFIGNKEPVENCVEKINARKKLFRQKLASNIHLKHIPEISFFYDDTMVFANRIDEIIKEIHKDDKPDDEKGGTE